MCLRSHVFIGYLAHGTCWIFQRIIHSVIKFAPFICMYSSRHPCVDMPIHQAPATTCRHLLALVCQYSQLFKTGKRFVDKSQRFVGTCLNEIVARIFQNIAALKDVFIINKSCISKTSTNIPSQTQQYLRLVHLLNRPSWLKVQVCVAQVHC